jgi:hypothetical protein
VRQQAVVCLSFLLRLLAPVLPHGHMHRPTPIPAASAQPYAFILAPLPFRQHLAQDISSMDLLPQTPPHTWPSTYPPLTCPLTTAHPPPGPVHPG